MLYYVGVFEDCKGKEIFVNGLNTGKVETSIILIRNHC